MKKRSVIKLSSMSFGITLCISNENYIFLSVRLGYYVLIVRTKCEHAKSI